MPVIEACLKATQWIAKQWSDRESAAIVDDVQDFYGVAEHQAFRANEQVSKLYRSLKEPEGDFQLPTESAE